MEPVSVKPKQYIRPMPATWWLHNRFLVLFMVRELSAVFVGIYAIILLVILYKANHGPEEFRAFYYGTLHAPWMIVLHAACLVFALIHSITFFNLTPKVVILRQGEDRVPDAVIAGAHYVLWLVITLVLIGLVWVLAHG